MTPKEQFNQEVWWILQEIKKEQLSTPKREKVEFSIRDSSRQLEKVDNSLPSAETQIKLLYKLKEKQALHSVEPSGIYHSKSKFNLTVHQSKFDTLYCLYESGNSYSENKNTASKTENLQSVIKPKSLELIAKEIGNLETGINLINFLTDCGVDKKLIEYPQTKWQMVYAVLIALATSPNPKNQGILFKIIEEASHPLMHNGDEEIAKTHEDKFNKLLKYDGFTLKNYKVKKINKEVRQDNDLDLYLKKKILVENWRDDLPHPITELSFSNNTVEQICYSLWDLFASDIIFFGANTFPEDILVETDPRFHKEIAFNWNLIGDLDNNPYKIGNDFGFEIEILNEKRLKKDIDEEISEFIANKVNAEKIEAVKEFYPDTKHLETPSYLRGISHNYYAYKKQKEILLNHIATLYNQFENEILAIKFNKIKDPNINILRTLLALESKGFFTIKELSNNKQEWTGKDNVFVKIKLVKSKIPILKKFAKTKKLETKKKNIENKQKPIPIQIVGGKMKIEGLQDGLKTIAKIKRENKNKFPYKLPAGTIWENFIIKFKDDENIFIQVGRYKHNTNYKEMGMVGKGKNPNPSEAWIFMKVLARVNGELTIKDVKAKDKYKKHKEFLLKALQNYFSLDYDPFYPYRSSSEKNGNSYKIKITLIPPPDQKEKADTNKNDDDLGIKEYLDEQTPQVYEDQRRN